MSTKTKLYPNPVWGNGNNYRVALDKNVVGFSPVEKDNDNFYCTISLNLEDETIATLFQEERAAFLCEIDCVKTNYRASKWEYGNSLKLEIPRTYVVDNVDLYLYIVAMKQIDNYVHPEFNENYEGISFTLEEGDYIADLGAYGFNASVKYSKCPSPSSLMQVQRASADSGITCVKFNPDEERIFIVMPSELFDIYTRVCGQNTQADDLFISTIAVDALAYALMTVRDNDTKLAANLRNLLEKNHIEIAEDQPEQCFDAARKLLEDDGVDPYTTFMKKIEAVITSKQTNQDGSSE